MEKPRRRYLSFQLHSENATFDDKQLSTSIWRSMLSLYGEVSAADSKLYLVEFDRKSREGILQCAAPSLSKVITSAVLIGSIGESLVSFEPKKVSGTIKALKR